MISTSSWSPSDLLLDIAKYEPSKLSALLPQDPLIRQLQDLRDVSVPLDTRIENLLKLSPDLPGISTTAVALSTELDTLLEDMLLQAFRDLLSRITSTKHLAQMSESFSQLNPSAKGPALEAWMARLSNMSASQREVVWRDADHPALAFAALSRFSAGNDEHRSQKLTEALKEIFRHWSTTYRVELDFEVFQMLFNLLLQLDPVHAKELLSKMSVIVGEWKALTKPEITQLFDLFIDHDGLLELADWALLMGRYRHIDSPEEVFDMLAARFLTSEAAADPKGRCCIQALLDCANLTDQLMKVIEFSITLSQEDRRFIFLDLPTLLDDLGDAPRVLDHVRRNLPILNGEVLSPEQIDTFVNEMRYQYDCGSEPSESSERPDTSDISDIAESSGSSGSSGSEDSGQMTFLTRKRGRDDLA